MRHNPAVACLAVLLAALLTPAASEADIITVQWSGPSHDAWQAAEEDFLSGGDGFIPDTDAYQGCRWHGSDFSFCHGFWVQGLGAGGSAPAPELDPVFSDRGFGLNIVQSMPDFEIAPSCHPGVFEPCYTEFTPLQLDWRYEGEGGSPFVWLSSKGGVLAVLPDWDGRFHGSEWRDIEWMLVLRRILERRANFLQGQSGSLHLWHDDSNTGAGAGARVIHTAERRAGGRLGSRQVAAIVKLSAIVADDKRSNHQ